MKKHYMKEWSSKYETLMPKAKRLMREGKLQAVKSWLSKYDGKNIVKGYSKHFSVNKLCAALELQMIGYEVSKVYIYQLVFPMG